MPPALSRLLLPAADLTRWGLRSSRPDASGAAAAAAAREASCEPSRGHGRLRHAAGVEGAEAVTSRRGRRRVDGTDHAHRSDATFRARGRAMVDVWSLAEGYRPPRGHNANANRQSALTAASRDTSLLRRARWCRNAAPWRGRLSRRREKTRVQEVGGARAVINPNPNPR